MATRTTDEELAFVEDAMGADLDVLVVFNLLRTHSRLTPFLDADLRQRDLTAAQLNALLLLRSAPPGGLGMGEIGQRLIVTKSNVTGLVDRLERQGLVVRTTPADRRATLVRLTPAGHDAVARALPAHTALLGDLTGGLTQTEKATLVRLLTKLRRELRRRRQEGK